MTRHSPARGLTIGVMLLALAACTSEPELEFADWRIPVPEGVTVQEHAPVPLEARDPSAIQLVDDLVIGGDVGNPAAILYEPRDIAVSADGDIFVADAGTQDIKMFDAAGAYQRTLGKEGQGPAEFGSISGITIAGDHLVVNDSRNGRFSIWTLEGEHIADHAPTERRFLASMQGLSDGSIVGYFTERDEDRSGRRVVLQQDVEGTELARMLEVPVAAPSPPDSRDPVSILQNALDSYDDPRINMAVGSGGVVYVTPIHEYQIFAFDPAGEMLWALRTAWDRFAWPESAKQTLVDSFASSGFAAPDADPIPSEALDWPALYSALVGISTDGAGRVFAFIAPLPTADNDGSQPPDEWPVDAYSPGGEFLGAGVVANRWSYAHGDFVYGTRPDDNDENVVVRYRLIVNER